MALIEDEKNKVEVKVISNNWIEEDNDSILIYGPPKSGKTWAYCSFIKDTIDKNGVVYLINTDKGVSKTFKQYFGTEYVKYKEKVNYYYINNLKDCKNIIIELKSKIKKEDLLVIDLLSEFWVMAQNQFIMDISGNDPINLITRASKDDSKFGVFSGKMWQYVRALHDYIVNPLIKSNCNVIGVCGIKDIEVEEKITHKKNIEYKMVGLRPDGQKQLTSNFNAIVFINKIDDGEKYFFQIMGNRGAKTNQKMVSYDVDFKEKFDESKKKQ